MKEVTFYYGISGTFKTTTIEAELEKPNEKGWSVEAMWSGIKYWKSLEEGIFSDLIPYSDLNYAILHLSRLKDKLYESKSKGPGYLYVERGVSDMLYYWINSQDKEKGEISKEWLMAVMKEEDMLTEQRSYHTPQKVLLVQKDIDFIKETIIGGPRGKFFPGGLQDYLKQQERYIEFTKELNNITKEVVIKDAYQYVTQTLGLKWCVEGKNK